MSEQPKSLKERIFITKITDTDGKFSEFIRTMPPPAESTDDSVLEGDERIQAFLKVLPESENENGTTEKENELSDTMLMGWLPLTGMHVSRLLLDHKDRKELLDQARDYLLQQGLEMLINYVIEELSQQSRSSMVIAGAEFRLVQLHSPMNKEHALLIATPETMVRIMRQRADISLTTERNESTFAISAAVTRPHASFAIQPDWRGQRERAQREACAREIVAMNSNESAEASALPRPERLTLQQLHDMPWPSIHTLADQVAEKQAKEEARKDTSSIEKTRGQWKKDENSGEDPIRLFGHKLFRRRKKHAKS